MLSLPEQTRREAPVERPDSSSPRAPELPQDLPAARRLHLHPALDQVDREDGQPEGDAGHPPADGPGPQSQVGLAAGPAEAAGGGLGGLVAHEEDAAAGHLPAEGGRQAAEEAGQALRPQQQLLLDGRKNLVAISQILPSLDRLPDQYFQWYRWGSIQVSVCLPWKGKTLRQGSGISKAGKRPFYHAKYLSDTSEVILRSAILVGI